MLEVRHLRGALEPTHAGKPPWFDDPGLFTVRIDQGEIAMTAPSLAALMNHYLFAGKDAPVKDVAVEFRDGHLIQTSTLNKKIPIRATLEGDVSADPGGRPAVPSHEDRGRQAAGQAPCCDLFGVELSNLIKSQESKGMRVEGDDLILDPEKLLPPPRIRGRVTAVRIEGDRMIQTFSGGARGKPLSPSLPKEKNYMFMSGNVLSFGKLTMQEADLQIIDADPKDPFDFFLSQYAKQLVAGYSRTMPDKGLVVYMPDSNETEKPLGP